MSFNPASEERQLYQIVHFSRKFLLLEKNILWNLLMKKPLFFFSGLKQGQSDTKKEKYQY
ncbi:hypothetical protein AP219_18145 [Escherichia coli]|nr:hypothetical protein Q459_03435 [Escherichia coli ATCC BAA-2215]OJF28096.1 hypothetical protein AP219_18145 [Escherichia coli]OJF37606.1 hypothetical protein AP220_18225 [Escherichia coli]